MRKRHAPGVRGGDGGGGEIAMPCSQDAGWVEAVGALVQRGREGGGAVVEA